jgi:nitrogen fixation protein FixH
MNLKSGKQWPLIVVGGMVFIVLLSVWTIKQAMDNPVEMSNLGMQNYHQYDAGINEIIAKKIAFDNSYNIEFAGPSLTEKNAVVAYRLTDKAGNPVNDATIKVVLTRPETVASDITLENPEVSDGVYRFAGVDLPKVGRWNIMAHITAGSQERFYNLKADTRKSDLTEY